jgi:twitching motility protein PilT
VHQIYSTMQAGAKFGMVTMDQSLGALVRGRKITMNTALEHCASEADLRRMAQSG